MLVIVGIERRFILAGVTGTSSTAFIPFATVDASLFFKKGPDCLRALIVYAEKVGRIPYGEVLMLSGHKINQD